MIIAMKAKDLRDWRGKVLARDGYVCCKCGRKIHVIAHHIKSQFTYPEFKLSVENGMSLCRRCHSQLLEFALRLTPPDYRYTRGKIDLGQLRVEIRAMTRSHALYRVLRDELTTRGFWRARPRGNPSKAYRVMISRL